MGKRKKSMVSAQEKWKFPLDMQKRAQSLSHIQQAAQAKRICNRPSFAENVWNQMRFQSWRHWAVQGAVLSAALLLVLHIGSSRLDSLESITACSVFLVFAGNLCLSGVVHVFSWHMAELEKTLYFDLKQMVCIQMFEAGLVDLAVLALLAGCVGRGSEAGLAAYLLYLLVPFLWADAFYLRMLSHLRNGFSGFRQLSMGILCSGTAILPAFWKDAYDPARVPVWGILFVAGAAAVMGEIYRMMKQIEGGESICLN